MQCPNCHSENRPSAKFCDECGFDLHASASSVTEEARAMFGDNMSADSARSGAITADLSGLETIVDSSYVPPSPQSRTGDTIEVPRISEDVAAPAVSYRADSEAHTSKRRPGTRRVSAKLVVCIVAVVVALCAIGAWATYSMQWWGGKEVPNVIGKSEVDARSILEGKGFSVAVELVKSDDVEGVVIATDPASGARKDEGFVVTMSVSDARIVPQVKGYAQGEVAQLMADEGLKNVEYRLVKSNELEGTALSVSPEAGQRAYSDTPIVVEIATAFTVPNVVGLDEQAATKALEEEGYEVTITLVNTEEFDEGTVVATEPEAGAKLASGSEVVIALAHNRSVELVNLTWAFLTASPVMTINSPTYGTALTYQVDSVTNVSWVSGSTCAFTMLATPFETHTYLFGLTTETVYGNQETISGTVEWNDDNSVKATSPLMTQGG